jgi:prepilin-type N-terminal cleavage/methylation domain-containing protein
MVTCSFLLQLLPVAPAPSSGKEVTGSKVLMTSTLRQHRHLSRIECGFSMTELVVVVTVVLIVIAIALANMVPSLKYSKSNAAMELVMGELRRAHERAIDERRIYRVTFVVPQTLQVDVGQVAIASTTVTRSAPVFVPAQAPLTLPTGIQFTTVAGIPTSPAATPDGFGSGVTAIDFDIANGGGGTQIYFQPDGSALDGANRLNDGVVYMAEPNNLPSSRAVSLFGSTGRVKGWYLTWKAGVNEWNQ